MYNILMGKKILWLFVACRGDCRKLSVPWTSNLVVADFNLPTVSYCFHIEFHKVFCLSIINVLYTCNFRKKFNYTNFLYFLCHFLRSFLCSYNNVAVSNFLKFWYSSVNIRMQNKEGIHYCSYFSRCTNFKIFIYINLSVDCLMVKFWAQLKPLEAHILPWMATNKATLYSDPEYCVLSCLWLCLVFILWSVHAIITTLCTIDVSRVSDVLTLLSSICT